MFTTNYNFRVFTKILTKHQCNEHPPIQYLNSRDFPLDSQKTKLLKIKTTDGQICEVFIGVCSLTTFGFILNKINSFKFGERIGKTIGGICSSKVKGHDQKLMVETICHGKQKVHTTFGFLKLAKN